MSPPDASALSSCLLADWLVVGPDNTGLLQRGREEEGGGGGVHISDENVYKKVLYRVRLELRSYGTDEIE